MSSLLENKVVRLKSSDNKIFEADECMIMMSKTIKTMMEDLGSDDQVVIPLEKVDSKTLALVVEWCANHLAKVKNTKFVEGLDLDVILHLMYTSYYLDIKELGDQMRETIADRAQMKAIEEISEKFSV